MIKEPSCCQCKDGIRREEQQIIKIMLMLLSDSPTP